MFDYIKYSWDIATDKITVKIESFTALVLDEYQMIALLGDETGHDYSDTARRTSWRTLQALMGRRVEKYGSKFTALYYRERQRAMECHGLL